MSGSMPKIGRCIGCDRPERLHDGVCEACLTRRGRKWAEMSNRCRTDPEFALSVYERIATDRGREMFLAMYGRRVLAGRGNTIWDARRMKQSWEWEAELTYPPPPPSKGDPNRAKRDDT